MKRHVVKHVVRHHNQMFGVQTLANGRDQQGIQLAQMGVSRCLQLRGERLDVSRVESELRELELQQPYDMPQVRDRTERYDVELVAAKNTDVGLAAGLVILEQKRAARQARANLLEIERRAGLEGRKLLIGAARFVQRSAELFLEFTRLFAERLHPFDRPFVGPGFFELELSVMPGQFLAKPGS